MIALELEAVEPLGRLIARPWADTVTGMQVDSRRIAEGDLFVAVGGGADFVEHALARGAAAALVPEDAFAALAAVAGAVRDRSSAKVVAITGSTGKTSTKDVLFALCAPHRRTVANEGNYNTEIGVPLTLCRIEPDTEIVISELGMRGLGQIAWLAAFVRPNVGVITNIGPAHLEFLGSIENIARAKAELLEALPAGGVAIVPDEPLLEPYLRDDLDIRRVDPERPLPFRTAYATAHQLVNTRFALAAAEALGVPSPAGELNVEFSGHREEELELPGGGLLLNDCYNANPVSMRAALANLVARAGGGRRVAVLGDMRELGPAGPAYHEEIGALIRELGIEQVLAVGELARAYGGEWVPTAADAAARVRELVRPGDTVLVKASLAVGLDAVAANLVG